MGLFDIFKKKASAERSKLEKEAKDAGYQAYMDYTKGSLTPEEAYLSRGFIKDKEGNWVYKKLLNQSDDNNNSSVNQQPISEAECTQAQIIAQEIQQIIFKYNEKSPGKEINFDNIFIGKCINKPGSIGCFYKEDGWYLYRVDDRFNLLMNGPFSLNGIIVALLHMLYIPAELQNRKFNDEEYKLYLSGEKPV